MNDAVNHPSHYTTGNVECIDAMVAFAGLERTEAFCVLAAFKYLWRCWHKGTADQDLAKARWYEAKAIELRKLIQGTPKLTSAQGEPTC